MGILRMCFRECASGVVFFSFLQSSSSYRGSRWLLLHRESNEKGFSQVPCVTLYGQRLYHSRSGSMTTKFTLKEQYLSKNTVLCRPGRRILCTLCTLNQSAGLKLDITQLWKRPSSPCGKCALISKYTQNVRGLWVAVTHAFSQCFSVFLFILGQPVSILSLSCKWAWRCLLGDEKPRGAVLAPVAAVVLVMALVPEVCWQLQVLGNLPRLWCCWKGPCHRCAHLTLVPNKLLQVGRDGCILFPVAWWCRCSLACCMLCNCVWLPTECCASYLDTSVAGHPVFV